jgi:hypothetical protein
MEDTSTQLISAEDRANTLYQRAPARDRTGKNGMMSARGGIESGTSRPGDDERAPLLSERGRDSSGEGDAAQDEDHKEYDQWEGMPWYKRPSVRD